MTGYGLIAAVPAYSQYKSAVDRYNSLIEHKEALQAAIGTYNWHKMDNYLSLQMINEKPNEPAPGLLLTGMLRVGNLVGKLFRAQASVVMTNTSEKEITLYDVEMYCSFMNVPFKMYPFKSSQVRDQIDEIPQTRDINKPIEPGETVEIMFKGGITSLSTINENLRQTICEAAGKKLITSCPKISIEDGIKIDIKYHWTTGHLVTVPNGRVLEGDRVHECYLVDMPGVLRYCGEAYFPEDVK